MMRCDGTLWALNKTLFVDQVKARAAPSVNVDYSDSGKTPQPQGPGQVELHGKLEKTTQNQILLMPKIVL